MGRKMILTSIWERYFLKETLKVFILFLFGFYALYVLIDYSNHSHSFQSYRFTFFDIASYYAYEFITRMNILVPFAILIACIKTLCSLNTHHELIALMASGIRLKRLLLPFVFFGLFFTGVIYFNTEFLQPRALKYHKQRAQARAKVKQKKHHHAPISQLTLEDGSSFIFQSYDESSELFFDAYWVRSIDDIYRIRELAPYGDMPLGRDVEHLQRHADGAIAVAEFSTQMAFPAMVFDKKTLLDTVSSPNDYSLSTLIDKLPEHENDLSEKEAELLTAYYYKLVFPWLCLLAVIGPAPFCTRFSRTLPVFFIYAIGLFGLFAFYLFMEAATVLAERQMVSPALAIWVPFGCFFGFFGWRFWRKGF